MKDIAKEIIDEQDESGMLRRSLERIIQLYTDKSHFIYELLQNAEDAHATKIKFIQHEDRLEVMHDGHPFTKTNLKGLCDIGKSDKTKELNQIGEFGVGFKSVFGICETVRLYSRPKEDQVQEDCPKFAVEITDFTHPKTIAKTKYDKVYLDMAEEYTTLFIFPYAVGFSFSGFKTVAALNEAITKRLKDLGFTTLLFMHHLQLIEYEIVKATENKYGYYELERKKINEKCELITSKGKNIINSEAINESLGKVNKSKNLKNEIINTGYLKFSKKIAINDATTNTVDIAYAIDIDEENNLLFKKPKHPYISVYFPTETESKLNFIIQGPFRTTPNRSSVPADDEDNIKLADYVLSLIHESVLELKKLNLLNLSFLGILPLREDAFDSYSLFKNVYNMFPEVFSRVDLLPTNEGGYTSSKSALIVRGKNILEFFDDETISDLIGDGQEHHWLPPQISETGTGILKDVWNYCNSVLNIEILRLEDLNDYFRRNKFFLPKMSDGWLIKLYKAYEQVPSVFTPSGKSSIFEIPLIKTSLKKFVAPYKRIDDKYVPNVYLPTLDDENTEIATVDYDIYKNCESFFVSLHIHAPERYTFFKEQIKSRYSITQNISDSQHISDIKDVIHYLKDESTNQEMREILKQLRILKCKINGKSINFTPFNSRIYFPKSESGLNIEAYFKNIADDKMYIDYDFYSENGLDYEQLRNFEITDSILTGENDTSGFISDGQGRPTRWSSEGYFRWNLSIDKLETAVSYIAAHPDDSDSMIKSFVIYKIVQANIGILTGIVTKGTGSRTEIHNEKAKVVRILSSSSSKWLYDIEGNVTSASNITKLELNSDIYGIVDAYSRIYDLLGFKKTIEDNKEDIVREYDRLSGEKKNIFFETELYRRFNITASDLEKVIVGRSQRGGKGSGDSDEFEFPVVEVKNWDALKKHAAQILTYSAPVSYKEVIRSVRTSHSSTDVAAYLKNMYRIYGTNKYACQICHNAVDSIEGCQLEKSPDFELEPLHICLCRNCAEKFKKIRNVHMLESQLLNEICSKTDRAITEGKHIIVNIEKQEIWFAQTHVAEIRELMNLKKQIPAIRPPEVIVDIENVERPNPDTGIERKTVTIISHKPKTVTESGPRPVSRLVSNKKPSYDIGTRIYHKSNKRGIYGQIINFHGKNAVVRFVDGRLVELDLEFCLQNKLTYIVDKYFNEDDIIGFDAGSKDDGGEIITPQPPEPEEDPKSIKGRWVQYKDDYWWVTYHNVAADSIILQLDPFDYSSKKTGKLSLKYLLTNKLIKIIDSK